MMKKQAALIVLAALLCFPALSARSDGVWGYRTDADGYAHITSYGGNESAVRIPTAVDGIFVVGVDEGAIPAFVNEVTSPALVIQWQEGAVPENALLKAANGSAALGYAREHGLRYENISALDFTPGVTDLSADEVTWEQKNSLFVFPGAYEGVIGEGSLFYVPPRSSREMGCVYMAMTPETSGGMMTVPARQAAADAAYESFSVSMTDLPPDYANMQVLSDRVTEVSYERMANSSTIAVERGTVRIRSSSVPLSAKTAGFKIDLPLSGGVTVTAQIELTLSLQEFSVSLKNHFGKVENAKLLICAESSVQLIAATRAGTGEDEDPDLEIGTNLLGDLALEIRDPDVSDSVDLARIPFMTTGGFTLCVVPRLGIGVDGKLSVSIDSAVDAGFSYDGEFHSLCKTYPPELNMEAAAGFTARLEAAFTASLPMVPDVAELTFTVIEIKGQAGAYVSVGTNAPRACIDLSLTGEGSVSVGLGLKNAIEKYKTWFKAARSLDPRDLWLSCKLFEATYFEKSLHYEPGIGVVDSCTRDGVKIVFDANGGTGGVECYYLPGEKVVFPHVTRAGYTLDGWLDEAGNQVAEYTVTDQEASFYAKWTQNESAELPALDPFMPEHHNALKYLSIYDIPDEDGDYFRYNDCLFVEANVSDPEAYYDSAVANAVLKYYDEAHQWPYYELTSAGGLVLGLDQYKENYRYVGDYGRNDSLTSIVYGPAFIETYGNAGSRNLRSVTFSNGIRRIGSFEDCRSLETVSVPDSVRLMDTSTFGNCISLRSAKLPAYIKKIPAGLFYNCSSLESVVFPTGAASIGEQAFMNCTSLTSLVLPSTVRSIGARAFANCTSLRSITLPEEMEFLARDAFDGCSALEEIVLPNGISIFPDFKGCVSLKRIGYAYENVFINSDVTLQFEYYPALETFELTAGNIIVKGLPALHGCETMTLTATGDITFNHDRRGSGGVRNLTVACGGTLMLGNMEVPLLESLTVSCEQQISYDNSIITDADTLSVTINIHGQEIIKTIGVRDCPNLLSLDLAMPDTALGVTIKSDPALETVRIDHVGDYLNITDCPALTVVDIDSMTGEMFCMSLPSIQTLTVPEGCASVTLDSSMRDASYQLSRIVLPGSLQTVSIGTYGQYPVPPVVEAPEGSAAAEICVDFLEGEYTLSFRSVFGTEYASCKNIAAGAKRPMPTESELFSVINGLDYEYVTWYEDEACTRPASQSFVQQDYRTWYRMPDHDVTLYAQWSFVEPEYERTEGEFTTPDGVESGTILTGYQYASSVAVIPASVKGIARDAIGSGTQVVIIPENLRWVEAGAFRGAESLRRIVVMPGNECFYTVDGALYDRTDTLLAVPACLGKDEFSVAEGTKGIADYAFGWAGCPSFLSHLQIPAGVVSFGAHAFDGLSANAVIHTENSTAQQALTEAGLAANPAFVLFMVDDEPWSYYTVAPGSPLPLPEEPYDENRTFLGWSEDESGVIIPEGCTVSADGMVLCAVWQTDGVPIDAAHFPDAAFRAYVRENFDWDGDGALNRDERDGAGMVRVGVPDEWIEEGQCTPEEAAHIRENYQHSITNLRGIEYLTGLRWLHASEMTAMGGALDVSANTRLESVVVFESGLTELTLGSLPDLQNVHCEDNALTSLDVTGCPALNDIHCMGNALTSLDLTHNPLLEYLYCYNNSLSQIDLTGCPALREVGIDNNRLTALNVGANTAMEQLYCSENLLTALDISHNTQLRVLNAGGNRLASLNLAACPLLEELYVYDNALTTLDVSASTALVQLECDRNAISHLDVSGLGALEVLFCYGNGLGSLDLEGCSSLEYLMCQNNRLTSLDITGCPGMQLVRCYGNPISSLDLSHNPALWGLNVYDTLLRVVDVSACPLIVSAVAPQYYEEDPDIDDYAWYARETDAGDIFWIGITRGMLIKTDSRDYTVLKLPSSLTEIGSEAFAGVAADIVIVPEGCERIGSLAFARCPNLKTVWLSSGTSVADDAFEGCGDVTLTRYD